MDDLEERRECLEPTAVNDVLQAAAVDSQLRRRRCHRRRLEPTAVSDVRPASEAES